MLEPSLHQYETVSGCQIFRLEVNAFPNMPVNIYIVLAEDFTVLIDTASGFDSANEEIFAGFKLIEQRLGKQFDFSNLTHIFLTHGHIDHFGGLPYLRARTDAKLGVHELDHRILDAYEETLAITSRHLKKFLFEAGVAEGRRQHLLEMYRVHKTLFHSVPVDFTYEHQKMRIGPFEMLHVPGHTAGHVLIRIDQCVFTGDHILEHISPHQAPEGLTLSTGLQHYLTSLEIAREWVAGARLVFPGHHAPLNHPIDNINWIQDIHQHRLIQVCDICHTPQTISSLSKQLFQHAHGYHELLALEETGAHVEYLYERGKLRLLNYADIDQTDNNVALIYLRAKNPTYFL